MQTSLLSFAESLASSARLMTTRQLARHPDLSWRTQPIKRASEFLSAHSDTFERLPGPVGQPHVWRLTRQARKTIDVRAVNPTTQRLQHWLGIGDIWCTLTFAGGRPQEWVTEWDGQFDIYCEWNGGVFLIEYQRTPITRRLWNKKWELRKEWYRKQKWQMKPYIVLVDATNQNDDLKCIPRGTVHVKSIEHLAHKLRRAMKPTP